MNSLAVEAKKNQSLALTRFHSQMDETEQRCGVVFTPYVRALKLTELAPTYIGEVLITMIHTVNSYPPESPARDFLSIFSSKLLAAWQATTEEVEKSRTPSEFQKSMIEGLDRMIPASPEETIVKEFMPLPVHENVRLQLMTIRNILSENDLSEINEMQDELPLVF